MTLEFLCIELFEIYSDKKGKQFILGVTTGFFLLCWWRIYNQENGVEGGNRTIFKKPSSHHTFQNKSGIISTKNAFGSLQSITFFFWSALSVSRRWRATFHGCRVLHGASLAPSYINTSWVHCEWARFLSPCICVRIQRALKWAVSCCPLLTDSCLINIRAVAFPKQMSWQASLARI